MPRKRRGHGEGTVYQRPDGRWRAQITAPGQGRISKTFGSRREATEWLARTNKKLQDGMPVAVRDLKLGLYLDRWLTDVIANRVRPNTLDSYTNMIRLHIQPALGHIPLRRLRPDHIQAFYSDRLAAGMAPGSVQIMHIVLSGALKQALRWGLVERNVAGLVDPPRAGRREMAILTADQVRTFLTHTRAHRLYALFVLAISTGMRSGELRGLHWSDLDLDNRRIHITHNTTRKRGHGTVITQPKTASSRRTVVLTPAAISALREHRTRQLEERLQAGGKWTDQGLVFPGQAGQPLAGSTLTVQFQRELEAAGLPRIRFHDLRHTAATLMLAAGTPVKVVQETLGHSAVSITLGIYTHVLPTMQEDAAARMQEILDG